jgi:hypothetical protein
VNQSRLVDGTIGSNWPPRSTSPCNPGALLPLGAVLREETEWTAPPIAIPGPAPQIADVKPGRASHGKWHNSRRRASWFIQEESGELQQPALDHVPQKSLPEAAPSPL